ncbi:hypothetical protein AFCA_003625 [Aspergillus flavus]|uniref:Aminoglycoside phosphotransferase domain-containing protein n=1 Tax=Aspergillus flavus TaxID=5059 RepID=A0AB74C0M5_ASPFL|nr:hypothetical protein CA14_000246 [Aspergillus flavus]UDD56047.1 hypothetical protein AFCA_003625 [Aspergillus flavus]
MSKPVSIIADSLPFKPERYIMSPSFSNHYSRGVEVSEKLCTIVQRIFTSAVHISNISPLNGHLHPLCLISLSNGAHVLLKCTPTPMTPLLRREQFILDTEARALALLKESGIPDIPQIFYYNSRGNLRDSAFLMRHYVTGATLHEMKPWLTPQNRKDIDRRLGVLAQKIGQHVSDSFGTLEQVASGAGRRSWREAFVILFESILRDSEDVFVNLPYAEIRHQLSRLSPALEEITSPQLVVIDFGHPTQVLVDPESKQLSGVVDLGKTLWGDIYMAEMFEEPSSSMLDGFGQSRIVGSEMERIRQLLYACYRSVERVTVQYYRNRDMIAENDARRRLTTILNKMAAI